jgi:hypothetical protein
MDLRAAGAAESKGRVGERHEPPGGMYAGSAARGRTAPVEQGSEARYAITSAQKNAKLHEDGAEDEGVA